MNAQDAVGLYETFLPQVPDPVAAATLAGLVYQAERAAVEKHRPEPYWDIKQVAAFWNVSESTAKRLADQGVITRIQLGGPGSASRFDPEEVRKAGKPTGPPALSYDSLLDDL